MPLSFKEIQATTGIAEVLYNFLPASPHPRANQNISIPGCASKLGLQKYWIGGSKLPALSHLLRSTLEFQRGKFCTLILEIVTTGFIYRSNKNPISREEIENLNKKVEEAGFRIKRLLEVDFLSSLPSNKETKSESAKPIPVDEVDSDTISKLRNDFLNVLPNLSQYEKGFAFERFLKKWFHASGLDPKASFRITGEQIDGSFQYNSNTYLVEAKWQKKVTSQDELLVFKGKIDGKSVWSRGLFVSYLGYSLEGLSAFSVGKSTNMIGMDGTDIALILDGKMTLQKAIDLKLRHAAETNEFFIPVSFL